MVNDCLKKAKVKTSNRRRKRVGPDPELPREVSDDEIVVSDEDVKFVTRNRHYVGFLSRLDTQSIAAKKESRSAREDEEKLEMMYEKRSRKKVKSIQENDGDRHQFDHVDALPVKTLDGKIYYRTTPSNPSKDSADILENGRDAVDKHVPKLAKAERREKKNKNKKANRSLTKNSDEVVNPQVEVLEELKEELSIEEKIEAKKFKLAEMGMRIIADPESNIADARAMLKFCNDDDGDQSIVTLGLLSLLAVYKDVIPGYRIRLPSEKEREMIVSKDVRKTRAYESALLSSYKSYLQRLMVLERRPDFCHVSIRCICSLVESVPHFNFTDSLLRVVINSISSPDDAVRGLCRGAVESVFVHDKKHRGEATLQAVHLIAASVKNHDCQLHPDSIHVFLSLRIDEELHKETKSEKHEKAKQKKGFRRRSEAGPTEREEALSRTRAEVSADYRAASLATDAAERGRAQSEILSSVFVTYFRVLKQAAETLSNAGGGGERKTALLGETLKGIGKFSHLLDLDFMPDLMNHLKRLAAAEVLTPTDRLRCCIVAFRVMRNNLDALNVDLNDFFIILYSLLLLFRPERDDGGVLAEALEVMLCEDRQHDTNRAASFMKRLSTFALACAGPAESAAALVAVKHLLRCNGKCSRLLENDDGGSPLAPYRPDAADPSTSGAISSLLWELVLLSSHYHPILSSVASSIAAANLPHDHVLVHSLPFLPTRAFSDLGVVPDDAPPSSVAAAPRHDRKKKPPPRVAARVTFLPDDTAVGTSIDDEGQLIMKFSDHFSV